MVMIKAKDKEYMVIHKIFNFAEKKYLLMTKLHKV